MKTTPLAALLLIYSANAVADYGAWANKNPDGMWTKAAEEAVERSNLPASEPADVEKFCPTYRTRSPAERRQFWAGLISIMARPESNFKPHTKYVEAFADAHGNRVVSRGLLQISIESANKKRYYCQIRKAEDLHDPATNINCGVKILNAWVVADNRIATPAGSKPKGGGRYWSTLRKAKHLPEISGYTSKLAVCRGS